MSFILSFLVGNPLGRTLAKVMLGVAIVGIVVLMIYKKGRNDQKLSRAMATLKAMKQRVEIDNEIRHMDRAARADALRRWVR